MVHVHEGGFEPKLEYFSAIQSEKTEINSLQKE